MDLLVGIEYEVITGSVDENITHVLYDSKFAKDESLFVSIVGTKVDGHKYINEVIKNGVRVIVVEKMVDINHKDITVIRVKDTRKALAMISSNFYGHPSKNIKLIGVTGTNGKTTTVFLINHILKEYGLKTGLIGTIECHIGDRIIESARTTPESLDLQKIFCDMGDSEVDTVVMEVSSHALDLDRVYNTEYDIGIFTNLSLDHLDYHKTMENYLDAKIKLFKICKNGVINIDDNVSNKIIRECTCDKIYTYSTEKKGADFFAKEIELTSKGVSFTLVFEGKDYLVNYKTPGKFSVYNALAAIAASYVRGVPIEDIIYHIGKFQGVRGRFQNIISEKGYSAIVDYAHSPDGLLNVLKSIKEFAVGRVITVVGCGGDRDSSKRPIMGKIASDYSDFVVITSDNPRTEIPENIIDQIEVGIMDTDCPYTKITDRQEGIEFALTMAEENDVVLIAGKGHETYQEIGKNRIHFNDVEIVLNYIQGES
ncbi:UDP-N-acetylmuramoyl-L-alanyl-D-glutamate--2,6-diaminopimelate ligase [Natranaerovirga pectinivora]|uniref:UDP-N-acetylmuramoyl-L-alanyl-D-glutamate--2, 6-diaminopimelate ligase n=1 Tax=Natranaerovirga pectinivora TaxID=682400 RepID=UPI00311A9922